MAKTLIPFEHYYQEEKFREEQQRVFSKLWSFVGFTHDLKNDQDFLCKTIAGQSIVIRNFEGVLKAFSNVCLHRASLICLEEKGQGAFQCPYHGWMYDQNGCVKGLPAKKEFEAQDYQGLALASYRLGICGRFIFVTLDPLAPSLEDYLAETYSFLSEISMAMDVEIDRNEIQIAANWKIVVENTLESYHIRMVHPTTFSPLGTHDSVFSFSGSHSSVSLQFATNLSASKKIQTAFSKRPYQIPGYVHHLIFPNLTIATAFGTTFSIQTIEPLNVAQTKFTSFVFSTLGLEESANARGIVRAFNESAIQFNRKVFDEDKMICEAVQQGMTSRGQGQAILSREEERILGFHQHYQEKWNA